MVRTQIQLPDNLYREIQRIAKMQEWSIAEVIRRGAETVIRTYPPVKGNPSSPWSFPPPIQSKLLISDPAILREAVLGDSEAAL